MSSNPPSGTSTPNPRFTSQTKTAEDLLSTQTVGLVNLSDYRKRRAEAIEQKERDVQDAILGAVSGRATPTSDGWVLHLAQHKPVGTGLMAVVQCINTQPASLEEEET